MNYGYEFSGKQNQFRLYSKSIDGKSLTDQFLARGKLFLPETVERLCRQFSFRISSEEITNRNNDLYPVKLDPSGFSGWETCNDDDPIPASIPLFLGFCRKQPRPNAGRQGSHSELNRFSDQRNSTQGGSLAQIKPFPASRKNK